MSMKKTAGFLVAVWLTLLIGIAYGGEGSTDFKEGTEPDGFRGLQWGNEPKMQSGLKRVGTDPSYGGLDVYMRSGDELKIGAADVSKIEYRFWKGKFLSVTIYCAGYVNCTNLKDATVDKFGLGYQANPYIETYVWEGPVTSMLLKYNEFIEEGMLHMFSVRLTDEAEELDREKAKEGGERGF